MKLKFIEAADNDGKKTNPRVQGVAYNGGKMNVNGWWYPVVVDLAGVSFANQVVLLANHENRTQSRIGVITPEIRDGKIYIDGEIVSTSGTALGIIEQAQAGADWQLSIGDEPSSYEFIDVDYTRIVNGAEHEGPFYHIQKSIINEVSVVAIGADKNTNMTVEASCKMEGNMPKPKDPKKKVVAQAEPPAAVAENLETIAGAQAPGAAPLVLAPGTAPAIAAGAQAIAGAQPIEGAQPALSLADPVAIQAAVQQGIQADRTRTGAIRTICAGAHPEIEAQAITEGWDGDKTSTAVLAAERTARPAAPNMIIAGKSTDGEDAFAVIEASVLMSGGLPVDHVAKITSDKVVSAAQRKYSSGMGLQLLLLEAAWRGGYTGNTVRGNERAVLQAAFSSMSLPGILSNVANKFLLSSFEAVEQAWRTIAAVRNVSDFKRITNYRLTGDMKFERIGPDGEFKHGKLGEESFGNQVDTYGKLFAITRQDIINDDLGALTQVPKMIGRGCGLQVNMVFWTEFLANSAFFTTDNGNLISGASSDLGIDSLKLGRKAFAKQTDSDGNPLSILPKFLLVPTELEDDALLLYNDKEITGAGTKVTKSNPNKGKVTPVASAYLSNENMVNSSATAWHLLGDPADIPFIEIAFLNGNQNPIVESAAADFDTLGIKMRGYFDFGVEKQDFRAGFKSAGV